MLVQEIVNSPVGPLCLAAEGDRLVEVAFAEGRAKPSSEVSVARAGAGLQVARRRLAPGSPSSAPALAPSGHPVLARARAQLAEYFAGERTEFDLPLGPSGTAFQESVWKALQGIPYGETVSYGTIAARIGRPSAVRAVGAANGANPIAIVIPCHRVIGADGSLTGYGGGELRKKWLLDHERAVASPR
ncbi:MAG TPA: methylated-DNA--[protein]-cysteine S-methyltransferase [Haliangiales bacterium]|nr:methylated-DNA--[protein]-cysteine S-methyltransferase [Haliangiales bacterium]